MKSTHHVEFPRSGLRLTIHPFVRQFAQNSMETDKLAHPPTETRVSRVMIVDDDPGIRRLVQRFVVLEGCQAFEEETAEAALDQLESIAPDVLILDWHLPGVDGLAALTQFSALRPALPIIMLTMENTVGSAVEAMKAGAFEYLTKPVDPASLRVALRAALSVSQERRQRADLEDTLGQIARQSAFPEILSCSPAMKPVFRLMERVLDRDLTVLIQGESGTGKELVAQAIHYHGKRSKAPFVVLNCAALPENLVESELFGHERGAFTGATASRSGHIEMADTGTLFLDEVGEMPLNIQPKFLRCLQDRKVQRVGGGQVRQVDFRLIAATNGDLMQGVLKQEFREDLFYRLAVYPIQLPPLRERPEDILLLLRHFLKLGGRKRVWIEPQAADVLEAYHWPGNVRELQNFASRLSVIVETDRVTRDIVAEQLSSVGQQSVNIPSNFTFTTETSANPVPIATVPQVDRAAGARSAAAMTPASSADTARPAHVPRSLEASPNPPGPPPPVATISGYSAATPAPGFDDDTTRSAARTAGSPADFAAAAPAPALPGEILPMAEVERLTIMRALEAFEGNVTETARALGIGRATLYRYIRKHNLAVDTGEAGDEE